jgi:hypothetical protein
MGRGGRGSPVPRRPVDLTGNLSVAERNDLTTLITAITEKLHNDISVIFDSPPVTPTLGDVGDIGHHHWLALSLQTNGKENVKPRSPSSGKGVPKVAAASQPSASATQPTDKEDSETITPQLRELKKEALIFFRKWQSIFLQRLRDISVTEPTVPQSNMRGRGRGNARGVRGGRVARGGRGGGRGGLALTTGKSSKVLGCDADARYRTGLYEQVLISAKVLSEYRRTMLIVNYPGNSPPFQRPSGLFLWTNASYYCISHC